MVVALMKRNPFAVRCHIPIPSSLRVFSRDYQRLVTNLQELDVHCDIWPCDAKRLLKNLPETIQQAALSVYSDKEEECCDHSADLDQVRPHHYLRSLHILGSFKGYQEYALLLS